MDRNNNLELILEKITKSGAKAGTKLGEVLQPFSMTGLEKMIDAGEIYFIDQSFLNPEIFSGKVKIGYLGEAVAKKFLTAANLQCVANNTRFARGETDLWFQDEDLHKYAVEVRSRLLLLDYTNKQLLNELTIEIPDLALLFNRKKYSKVYSAAETFANYQNWQLAGIWALSCFFIKVRTGVLVIIQVFDWLTGEALPISSNFL